MAGLLSGLAKLGLKNLEDMDLFEAQEENDAVEENKEAQAPEVKEEDFLFDKTYECPVCYQTFKSKTVRSSKARLLHTDRDLRPVYEHIDPLKYDVVVCNCCGYAVHTKFFGGLTPSQIKAVRENISMNFKSFDRNEGIYSYEEAYVCLKTGWLLRSYRERLAEAGNNATEEIEEIQKQETEFLKNALEGFITAMQTERFPICGMDEQTLEYLIAVLAMEFEQYEISAKMISSLLVSKTTKSRTKEKARDLKQELIAKIKEKNAAAT